MFSLYTIFYFKLERMCHLFFKFANIIEDIYDGYETFLFTKEHNIEMHDVFLNINMLDILLKNIFSDIYKITIPVEMCIQCDELVKINTNKYDNNKIIKQSKVIGNIGNTNEYMENKHTCKICDFGSDRLSDYTRHLETIKHITNANNNIDNDISNIANINANNINNDTKLSTEVKKYTCLYCGKKYKHNQTLWTHKKKCNEQPKNMEKIMNELNDLKLKMNLLTTQHANVSAQQPITISHNNDLSTNYSNSTINDNKNINNKKTINVVAYVNKK